jgi:hypothetical protein
LSVSVFLVPSGIHLSEIFKELVRASVAGLRALGDYLPTLILFVVELIDDLIVEALILCEDFIF